MIVRPIFWLILLLGVFPASSLAQKSTPTPRADLAIAKLFAPEFHQALGDHPRFDYITNFNFDGDWRGDNNWANAENEKYPLRGYVYYSVIQTKTHYYIHYAAFHPRDYKGGDKGGAILSELIKKGAKYGSKYDPTGKLDELALAHENDLEGCLVVVLKGDSLENNRVVYVETVSHNHYLRYVTAYTVPAVADGQIVQLNGTHPQLYVEPKGHGIESFNSNKPREAHDYLVYAVGDSAGDPTAPKDGTVAFELVSVMDDLWPRAQQGVNETYGDARDYREIKVVSFVLDGQTGWRDVRSPAIGSAFNGKIGMPNAARPPWGWFDGDIGVKSAGDWFFDPAGTIKQHFALDETFAIIYTSNEFLTSTTGKPVAAGPK